LAICSALILATLGVLGAVIYFKDEESVRASSPPFLIIMLIGSISSYIGIMLWSINPTSEQCASFPWFLGLGFIALFGALFAKVRPLANLLFETTLTTIKDMAHRADFLKH